MTIKKLKGYKCKECGLIYNKKNLAEKCQEWHIKHKSCNPNIIKQVIN